MRILIVEDERALCDTLVKSLKQKGYEVDACYDGESAVNMARTGEYDLIILDLMMPKKDGLEACQEIRGFSTVPIIMLTARSEDADMLMGFESGADDYVTKPFNPVEVLARVKSQLRRYLQLGSGTVRSTALRLGGIALDDRTKEVTLDGDPVSLTPREYDILHLLMGSPGTVFSPKRIYRAVCGEEPFGVENAVAVHIRHLREKLEIDPSDPRYIKVVWGQGYKMEEGKP